MTLKGQIQKSSLPDLPPYPAGTDVNISQDTGNRECFSGSKLFSDLDATHLIFVGLAVAVVLLLLLRKMFYMLKGTRRRRRRRRSMTGCSCRSRECVQLPCPR